MKRCELSMNSNPHGLFGRMFPDYSRQTMGETSQGCCFAWGNLVISDAPTYPVPQRRPHPRRHHGHEFDDSYAWLADPQDEEVLAHLRAENAYAEAMTDGLEPLRGALFEEITRRTQESDLSVPVTVPTVGQPPAAQKGTGTLGFVWHLSPP